MGWREHDRSYLSQIPLFAGKNGGGGNRTRVGRTPESLPLQELLWIAADAWEHEQEFVWRMRVEAWQRKTELSAGSETNLYAVVDGDAVKIGIADKPISRWKNLQVGNPRDLILFAALPATDTLERFLHSQIAEHRIRGEWFSLHPTVLALIEELLGVAQILRGMEENECGPVDSEDSVQVLVDWVEEAMLRSAA